MILSLVRKDILNFYGLTDYENYEVIKMEANNVKIYNKKTEKIIDLRY